MEIRDIKLPKAVDLAKFRQLRTEDLPNVLLKQAADYRTRAINLDRVQQDPVWAGVGQPLVDPVTGADMPPKMTNRQAADFLHAEANKRENLARQLLNGEISNQQALAEVLRQPQDAAKIREANGNHVPYQPDSASFSMDAYKHTVGDLTTHAQPAEKIVPFEDGATMAATQAARNAETIKIQEAMDQAKAQQASFLSRRQEALALSDNANGLLHFVQDVQMGNIEAASGRGKKPYAKPESPKAPASTVEPTKVRGARSRKASEVMTQIEKATPGSRKASSARNNKPTAPVRKAPATRSHKSADAVPVVRHRPAPRQSAAPRDPYMSPTNQNILQQLMSLQDQFQKDLAPQQAPKQKGLLQRLPLIGGIFGG